MADTVKTVSVVWNAVTDNFNKSVEQSAGKMSKFATSAARFGSRAVRSFGLAREAVNLLRRSFKDAFETAQKGGKGFTPEDLQNIKNAQKAVEEVGKEFDKLVLRLIADFAPGIIAVADGFKILIGLAKDLNKEIQKFVKPFQGDLENKLLDFAASIGLITQEIADAGKKVELGETIVDKEKEKKKPVTVDINVKSFSDAVEGGTSKAFDILNPDRPGSVQQEQLTAQKETAENTSKIADKLTEEGVKFVEVKF